MTPLSTLSSAIIPVIAIAAATVAVSLGRIDAQTYAAIVAGFGGFGAGASAHAAGVATTKAP